MKSSWTIITWMVLLFIWLRVTDSVRNTCEGQNGAMVGASQEMAFGVTGDAEGLSPAGTQPRSSNISHSGAGSSPCLCALCWEPLLRLHKIFSPSFAEPYTMLTLPSTESKADVKEVIKKKVFAMQVYQDLAMSRKYYYCFIFL